MRLQAAFLRFGADPPDTPAKYRAAAEQMGHNWCPNIARMTFTALD
jgi:hypothetical protein